MAWKSPPTKPSTVPYFYGRITRDEAEEILREHNCMEGMFLLRESISPLGNYAISICHDGKVHHYSIEKQTDGMYMIPAGKRFPGPVELIAHHQGQKDGIVTLLTYGCNRLPEQVPVAFWGMTYSDLEEELHKRAKSIRGVNKEVALGSQREHLVIMVAKDLHQQQPWFHGKIDRNKAEERLKNSKHKDGKFLVRLREDKKSFAVCISYQNETRHYLIDKDENNKFGIQDGPKFDCIMMLIDHYHNKQDGLLCKLTEPCPRPGFSAKLLGNERAVSSDSSCFPEQAMDADGLESIYVCVPRTLEHFELDRNQIEVHETLGSGQFGSVCKGKCTLRHGQEIPVAIKTLKKEDCPSNQEPELIREAKVMMPLSHKHIVRMIGVCRSDSIMLVLELAPLGQLNTYLAAHKETTQANIVELLWQVAMGMEYLESKKFVHRDLAARNVLLVSEHFAKINDFGMSKALCRDKTYYEAKEAGKWPLKWYAPECVYYWKFDSKSDVWSFGVTMWEATSYGDRPYKRMKGQEILQFLVEEGKRLSRPDQCDEEVYDLMLHCWEYDKHERPTFKEIATEMSNIYKRMKGESAS